MNKLEYRDIRGKILEFLYLHLFKLIEDESIFEMLKQAEYEVSLPLVQGHLRYLADKGKEYIEFKETSVESLGLTRNMVRITVRGADFIEGWLPEDPGICRKTNDIYNVFPEIRGWILKILYKNLPEWTSDRLVSQILMDGAFPVNPPQIYSHFCYLAEKELIELKDATLNDIGLSRHLAKLTSDGVDFVEGSIEIIGVTRQ